LIQETIGLLEERLEEHKKDLRTYHDSNVVISIARAKRVVEEVDPSSELLVSRIEENMRQFDINFVLSEYEFASELQLSKFRDEVCELLEKEDYAKRNFNADNDARIAALETRLKAISLANSKFVNKNAEI
jgi:archaellum component FlaC